jgi:hypothetical protein
MFQLLGLLKVIWSNNFLYFCLFFNRLNFFTRKKIILVQNPFHLN